MFRVGEVNSAGRATSRRPTRRLIRRVYSLTDPSEVMRKETSELRIRNAYNIFWTNVFGTGLGASCNYST